MICKSCFPVPSNLPETCLASFSCFAYNRDKYVKWVEAYPDYWHMLCNPASPETARSVTPEIAEQVMKTLQEYDQTELQMVWLFRYGTLLDVFGNATDEKIQ